MIAKKSLGQNFLIDREVVADIIAAAQIKVGESVIEVGPGEGILTEALLKAGAKVTAIEKDDRLIPHLETKFAGESASGNLKLIHGDALTHTPPAGAYKIVANIPYYITGELIQKFLSVEHQPTDMVLMLQKEVAERIVAKDGKESILSLSVKAYGTPEYIRTVDRSCFQPAPNVDSAVLRISDISHSFFKDIDEKIFFSVVKQGFASKRKQLHNNLPNLPDELKQKFGTKRAENLTLTDWKELAQLIHAKN